MYEFHLQFHWSLFPRVQLKIHWNLYNETGKVLLKTHKFHHLSGTVFTKVRLFYLSWKITCLERPQNTVVALYRFHCIPALVQIMVWRWPGDKPLSEPMMVSLPTYICVTQPQWVKCSVAGADCPSVCPSSCLPVCIDFTALHLSLFYLSDWYLAQSLIPIHAQGSHAVLISWKSPYFWSWVLRSWKSP